MEKISPLKKMTLGALLVGATLGGGAVGAALIGPASAQDSPTTTAADSPTTTAADSTATTADAARPAQDPTKGGHQANGVTEALLTGDAATKATAAAEAAVPGGTVQRVENDAEGDAYEAHMLDASGNEVVVKLDASFGLVQVEQGHGR